MRHGFQVTDKNGEALVEKRTKLMSNSPEVLKRVGMQCTNRTALPRSLPRDPWGLKMASQGSLTSEKHRHADTTGGRVKQCQVYPKKFCRAVCAGIAAQKRLRNLGLTAMPLLSLSAMESLKNSLHTPSEDLHETDCAPSCSRYMYRWWAQTAYM